MNIRALWAVAATLLLPAAALAQKDRVVLVDGTVLDRITVTSFTSTQLGFRKSGAEDQRTSDLVAEITVERVQDAYKRAYAAAATQEGPETFIAAAEEQKEPFLKQFGYEEAARLYLARGQHADAFAVLDELAKQVPDSGFLPLTYTAKIEYYLANDQAADALKVARAYAQEAQVKALPRGFLLEARYYVILAEAAAGETQPNRFREQLGQLANDAAANPDVEHRARLQRAHSLRREEKLDEALAVYDELIAKKFTTEAVRAGAYLGRGQVQFAKGTASDTEPFREALLSFLRVYIETPEADPAVVAEALFMASQAAEKWGGEEAARMKGRLRYVLQRDYPESPWSER